MTNQQEITIKYPWINNQLFERVLQKENPNEKIKINNYTIEMGSSSIGLNFGSDIIRAKVDYLINEKNAREIRLIIKAELANPMDKTLLYDDDCFNREAHVYKYILPEVERILLEIGDHTKLSAKCYEFGEDSKYLIFEDLTFQNYTIVKYGKKYNMDHFNILIDRIAKLHAATAVLCTKNVDFKRFYPHAMEYTPGWQDVITSIIEICADVTKSDPELEYYSEKLTKLLDIFYDRLKEAVARDEDNGFNVFCHGDLWLNNILFKYNEDGNPLNVVFIDYQMPYWGSPILDLVNSFYSSSENGIQEKEWCDLIQHYHETLSTLLEKLNYTKTIPSLDDLFEEYRKRAFFYMPFRLWAVGRQDDDGDDNNDKSDGKNENNETNLPESETSIRNAIQNPKHRNDLKSVLEFFDKKGYLD